jgi:hypothetical protein
MAQGPICIITPTGMVCASSPKLKRHHVFGTPCKDMPAPSARNAAIVSAVQTALRKTARFSKATADLYGTVVQVMLEENVDDTTNNFLISRQ